MEEQILDKEEIKDEDFKKEKVESSKKTFSKMKIGGGESGRTGKNLLFIAKTSIYLLIFLLPLFFLPWTNNILQLNNINPSDFTCKFKFATWISGSQTFNFYSLQINFINCTYISSNKPSRPMTNIVTTFSPYRRFDVIPYPYASTKCFHIDVFIFNNSPSIAGNTTRPPIASLSPPAWPSSSWPAIEAGFWPG